MTDQRFVRTDHGLLYSDGTLNYPAHVVTAISLLHAKDHAYVAHCSACEWFGPERLFCPRAAEDASDHLGRLHADQHPATSASAGGQS